jgi:hypothetical protein
VIVRQKLKIGEAAIAISESVSRRLATVFEDDGDTGYFYAMDLRRDRRIVDAVHIYNVSSVIDPQLESEVEILWSTDGWKSLLRINGYPHAFFDFSEKRGCCRTGFPTAASGWHRQPWDDAFVDIFGEPDDSRE